MVLIQGGQRQREAETIGTEAQFEELVTKYEKLVYTLCCRMSGNPFDAQDLSQETFLCAYQRLADFDGEHERAWICRIATNKCLDYLKSAQRRAEPAKDETFAELKDLRAGPEQEALLEESKREMLSLCGKLSPPYGDVARAHFCEEKSVKEIADEKGVSARTVQTQVYRAKALLRKMMKGGRVS